MHMYACMYSAILTWKMAQPTAARSTKSSLIHVHADKHSPSIHTRACPLVHTCKCACSTAHLHPHLHAHSRCPSLPGRFTYLVASVLEPTAWTSSQPSDLQSGRLSTEDSEDPLGWSSVNRAIERKCPVTRKRPDRTVPPWLMFCPKLQWIRFPNQNLLADFRAR